MKECKGTCVLNLNLCKVLFFCSVCTSQVGGGGCHKIVSMTEILFPL